MLVSVSVLEKMVLCVYGNITQFYGCSRFVDYSKAKVSVPGPSDKLGE